MGFFTDNISTVVIPVTRSKYSSGAITVSYETVRGSVGIAEIDYQHVDGDLTWEDGELGSKFIEVPIFPYDTDEPVDWRRDFFVQIDSESDGVVIDNRFTQVRINSWPEISNWGGYFSAGGGFTFREGSAHATIGVNRLYSDYGAVRIKYEISALGSVLREGFLDWSDGNSATQFIQFAVPDNETNDVFRYSRYLFDLNYEVIFSEFPVRVSRSGPRHIVDDEAVESEPVSCAQYANWYGLGGNGVEVWLNRNDRESSAIRLNWDSRLENQDEVTGTVAWEQSDFAPKKVTGNFFRSLEFRSEETNTDGGPLYTFSCFVGRSSEYKNAANSTGDRDDDGLLNLYDFDFDNDGVDDIVDAFETDPMESKDSDRDGIGDNSDPDNDNDGFSDAEELTAGTDPLNRFSCPDCFDFDIDKNLSAEPLSDGLLVIRYLFGFAGESLSDKATAVDGAQFLAKKISLYLSENLESLDIDGDGESKPLTDGLLLIRYLFGFSGDSLTAGAVGLDATRTTAEEIESYIEARTPSN